MRRRFSENEMNAVVKFITLVRNIPKKIRSRSSTGLWDNLLFYRDNLLFSNKMNY
ncbi:MAG: hypothetical protein JWM28_4326 [Chitinophagaceae bacterium]|nr:hypothetical protein [Chitinophagaceae bacterium]